MPDLIGGQVQVKFDLVVSSVEQIRAGRQRPSLRRAGSAAEHKLDESDTFGLFGKLKLAICA
jgi:tripartite-type tricarboxylate transporter receptor subunit TctC